MARERKKEHETLHELLSKLIRKKNKMERNLPTTNLQ
jgi:hypothetical protein